MVLRLDLLFVWKIIIYSNRAAEVLRVDGPYAICRFHGREESVSLSSKTSRSKEKSKSRAEKNKDKVDKREEENIDQPDKDSEEKLRHWNESRVLRVDDLIVIKPGSIKQAEYFQKHPRKISVSDGHEILTWRVDKNGNETHRP